MNTWWRSWGKPLAKGLLALAILVGVGRQFYRDLGSLELSELNLRWQWIALSAGLYLLGIGFSALYWLRLMRVFGDEPDVVPGLRAYYIGHLGKYVPGKAWALLLRAGLVTGAKVRFGVAVMTAFYEVLTTMATGALIAALVFALDPPEVPTLRLPPAVTGLLLLGLCGIPLLPGVFNRLVERLVRRFPAIEAKALGRIQGRTLAEGMALTAVGWALLGASVWAMLVGVLPVAPSLTAGSWAQYAAILGLGYVAGFLAFVVPGGVGVREFFLLNLLTFAGPEASIALAVVLLRGVWTVGELVVAGLFWPMTVRKAAT